MEAPKTIKHGEPLTLRLVGEGGAGGRVYSVTGYSVPGMSPFDPTTGVSTGTPTAQGHFVFLATVQDSSATVVNSSFSIFVSSRLSTGDVTPAVGEVGIPYTYNVSVVGATGAVAWALLAGNLPAGLSLSSAGVISGTPTTPHGISYATLRATDAGSGDTLDVAIVIDIRDELRPLCPTLTCDFVKFLLRSGESGRVNLMPLFAGGVPPYTVEQQPPYYTALSGMSPRRIRPDGHWEFVGTPLLPGLYTTDLITVPAFVVTDAIGATINLECEITVAAARASIGIEINSGGVAQRSAPTINFVGTAVSSVTYTDDKTTVTINATGVASVGATSPIVSSGGATPTISHATSGVSASTYTHIASLSVNASGHITSIASGSAPVTSVAATSPIVSSGGTAPTISHATSGVAAGTYSLATITVNAQGHITGAISGSASAAWGSIGGTLSSQTDLQSALDGKGNLSGGNAWTGLQEFGNALVASGPAPTTTTAGLQNYVLGGACYIRGYDGGASAFMPTMVAGSQVQLRYQTTARVTVNSTGVQLTGTVTSATPIGIASGGTGAATAAAARTALGLSGAITVSNAAPTGGADGDVWLQW